MSGSQSLERGLEILNLLDASRGPMGVREISRKMQLSPSIVQRLIKSLLKFNFVNQDELTKQYYIGYGALALGNSLNSGDPLMKSSYAELQRLATEDHLTGYLGIRQDNMAMYLLCVQSEGPVAILNRPGEKTHLHSTAMGKILLAAMDDDQLDAFLATQRLPAITEKTITDPRRLKEEVLEARKKGYASVSEETILGVISVGAPVYDNRGEVRAAMSVSFAERSSPGQSIESVAPIIQEAALRTSRHMGWRG